MLQSMPKQKDAPNSKASLARVRAAVNKSYVPLISKLQCTKEMILSHKREINDILDELLTV